MATFHSVCENQIAGNYDLEKTIGKGHFAVVKLAKHAFSGERVAVKIIDKTKLDATSKDHLFQEVLCMKLVQHAHVVRLYEVIDTTNKLYLIQEWGDGGDLYDFIMSHTNGLTEHNARKYFNQILKAISYCHGLHVVHRDLKPENVVFFKKTDVVKLTDFGFSNKFTPGTHLQTSCGSLAYSAPEILLGDSYDAPKVDIWSLGVILYMLVCGQLPFQEANDSETLTKIMDCHYTLPSNLSLQCCDLIQKMLLRDPDKRISLQEIMHHQWICEDEKENKICVRTCEDTICCNLPLICQHRLTYEDHMEILNLMSDGQVGTQAEIQEALDSNEYNYLTATYFLLAERKLMRSHYHRHLESTSSTADSNITTTNHPHSNNTPLSTIRILSNENNTPEERLRRFSMILEDEEEKDEEEIENQFLNETSALIPVVDVTEDGYDNEMDYSQQKSSTTIECGRHRTLCSIELGEELVLDPQGVAILRYSSSAADTYRSFRQSSSSKLLLRRRGSLGHVSSLPYLLEGISEEMDSTVVNKEPTFFDVSGSQTNGHFHRRNVPAYSYPYPMPPSVRHSRRESKTKRRSLPLSINSTSPHHRRRRIRLNVSKNASRSYSNSSDNSDSEAYVLLEKSKTQIFSGDDDISSFKPLPQPHSSPGQLSSLTPKCQSFPRRQRSNTPPRNTSRSSSGSNLRDHCAPIKEDDEPPVGSLSCSSQPPSSTSPLPYSPVWPPPGVSATSTPTPTNHLTSQHSTGHEWSRRRSDYGGSVGNSDTPARHSVHGTINYRTSQTSASVAATSLSNVSRSNISLSSLASSLRGSKIMMEVIRGTYELQLHQRSKGASSVCSSASQHERLDQLVNSTDQGPLFASPGTIMTITENEHTHSQCSSLDNNSFIECSRDDSTTNHVPSTLPSKEEKNYSDHLQNKSNVNETEDSLEEEANQKVKLKYKFQCCRVS